MTLSIIAWENARQLATQRLVLVERKAYVINSGMIELGTKERAIGHLSLLLAKVA